MNNISLNLYRAGDDQREVNKFKEKAAVLFQKLNALQQTAELGKSNQQRQKINQFNQKENKIFENQKAKEDRFARILQAVSRIEREIEDQRNQEERCRRAVKTWIESAERELTSSFQKLQKERIKSEAGLEQFIESKLQSFILKNKTAWNQGPLLKPEVYLQEIDHVMKQHKKFLEDLDKECQKLRKQTYNSIKECTRLVEQEVTKNQEDSITNFMKMVHMDISAKLKLLRQQRQRIEDRVINVLERVVSSCIPEYKMLA